MVVVAAAVVVVVGVVKSVVVGKVCCTRETHGELDSAINRAVANQNLRISTINARASFAKSS